MSTLGSLYIKLGEPEGEIKSCCDLSEWASQKIKEQHESMINLLSELNCFRRFYTKTLSLVSLMSNLEMLSNDMRTY